MIVGKITNYNIEHTNRPVHVLGNLQVVEEAYSLPTVTLTVIADPRKTFDMSELQELTKKEIVIMSRKEYEDYMHFKLTKIITTE